jgi:NAD(P)-dependent dehydrogenase (short-subunit alcohol dehydrogenase family)
MRHVVITGVSSGVDRAAAQELIDHGFSVFGSVRNQATADHLGGALGERFTPLIFDVTDAAGVQEAVARVGAAVGEHGLTGLVNNAGIAVAGPLMHMPLQEFRRQFEVNAVGLLAVTQSFLPLLGATRPRTHPPGRIVNISSVGGKIVFPFLGAYAASKHAVEAVSDALRRELVIYGIDVVVIEPGFVRTAIWDKAEDTDELTRYAGTDYAAIIPKVQKAFIAGGRAGLPPERVARTIREALETSRPRARYAVSAHPLTQWLLPRYLPTAWVDRLIERQTGLVRTMPA